MSGETELGNMESLGEPASNVAVVFKAFSNLRLGRSGDGIVGRLIRCWDSRNVKRNGEFMGITILLLDETDSCIHGFIPANRASHYRFDLKEGCVLKVDRFEVARAARTYKITEHEFMIRFIPSTRIFQVKSEAVSIKNDKFMVRRFNNLQVIANTNSELPDVVGVIQSVQGSDLNNISVSSRVVVRLCMEENNTVYLSLWDEAASSFRGLFSGVDKIKVVMLVTTVNPKIFGGNLYLNSTAGTKFYFDSKIPEIAEYVNGLGEGSPDGFTWIDTLGGIKKKEAVTIGDLNKFISNSNEQSQEADFICKAQIVGVLEQNGWSFVSCTSCNKKLERSETSLYCLRCGTEDVTGVVRFRVEFSVDDGMESATFVVFDKEMMRLIKREASVLALEQGPEGEGDVIPDCLNELIGREFTFQIRVTPFNFTPNHRTFTVSTIIDDSTISENEEEKMTSDKHEKDEAGVEVKMSAESAIPISEGSSSVKHGKDEVGVEVKMSAESAKPISAGSSNAKYHRKRRRE